MAKYMTQDVFNMSVVTAAKVAMGGNKSLQDVAEIIASNYQKDYADANLASDIVETANDAINYIKENLPQGSMVANFTQLQFSIKEFNPDGSKKKKGFFGGTFFNYEKHQLENKHKAFMANLIAYHLSIVNGSIPIAPPNWNMQ